MKNKIIIKKYDPRSSKPYYHYLSVTVLTKNESFFDKFKPGSIDSYGKDKLKFGWSFCWSCEEDYTNVPKKQLAKAKRLAAKLAKNKKVLKCTLYNWFL